MITLPRPALDGTLSVEASMHRRKSARSYITGALTIAEVSQLLWAAQGINRQNGMRTAPSAGALYPLEVYLVAGNVDDLPPGVYHYHPHEHALELITGGDLRPDLALGQPYGKAVSKTAPLIWCWQGCMSELP